MESILIFPDEGPSENDIHEISLKCANPKFSHSESECLLFDHPSIYSDSKTAISSIKSQYPLCPLCINSNKYDSWASFELHVSSEHISNSLEKPQFVCVTCCLDCVAKASSKCRKSVQRHFHCPYCGKILIRKQALESHLVDHSRGARRAFTRKRNHRKRWGALIGHLPPLSHPSVVPSLSKLLSSLKLPKCPLCHTKKTYEKLQSLHLHVKRVHGATAVFLPSLCLLRCQLLCDGIVHGHYHCPQCAFLTTRARHIYSHVTSHESFNISCGNMKRFCSSKRDRPWKRFSSSRNISISSCDDKIAVVCIKEEPNAESDPLQLVVTDGCNDDSFGEAKQKCSSFLETEDFSFLESSAPPKSDGISLSCKARDLQEAFDLLSLPNCYLCNSSSFTLQLDLEVHFYRSHVRHSFAIESQHHTLVCGLPCSPTNGECGADGLMVNATNGECGADGHSSAHYHCKHCSGTFETLRAAMHHYEKEHNSQFSVSEQLRRKDLSALKCSIPPTLRALLGLEVDAKWRSFLPEEYLSSPPPFIVQDAYALYLQLRPLHCVLCDDGREWKSDASLLDHFDRTHLKRAITVTPVPTLMCRRSCKGATRGHYHCSFCTLMSASTSKIQIHVNNVHSHLVGKAALDVANGRPIDLAGCAPTNEKSDLKSCDEPHDRDREKYGGTFAFAHPISVYEDLVDAKSRLQLPSCFLCKENKIFISTELLTQHFDRIHVKRSLFVNSLYILNCRLHCAKYPSRGHHHCPHCPYATHDNKVLRGHIEKHDAKGRSKKLIDDAVLRAELENPDQLMQYKVNCHNCTQEEREIVGDWQQQFNHFIKTEFAVQLKRNSCVLTHHRRRLIINHILFGGPLEPQYITYITFKNFQVVSAPQVGLVNYLVLPKVHYGLQDCDASLLNSEEDFYGRYRRVACVEEFFRVLYELHIPKPSENHSSLFEMLLRVRERFVFLPQSVVKKFVELCPVCGPPPVRGGLSAPRTLSTGGELSENFRQNPTLSGFLPNGWRNPPSRFMSVLQVNLVTMSDYPDGDYDYIVHCQDRHTLLHVLFPLRRLEMQEVAQGVVRNLICLTGLPGAIVSDSGHEFVKSLIQNIAEIWSEPCDSVLANSSVEATSRLCLPRIDSNDVIEEISGTILANIHAGIATRWSAWLRHLQYRLNLRCSPPELSPFQQAFHRSLPPLPPLLSSEDCDDS